MVEKIFTVTNPSGIHARRATSLIQIANRFMSEIKLEHGSKLVNLKSIMGVMSLGLEQGTAFKLQVEGVDEEKAFNHLVDIFHKEGLAE